MSLKDFHHFFSDRHQLLIKINHKNVHIAFGYYGLKNSIRMNDRKVQKGNKKVLLETFPSSSFIFPVSLLSFVRLFFYSD